MPLRSIADDVWRRFIDGLERLGVRRDYAVEVSGLQMMGNPGSPFFNKLYVATTFDTFSLSCFKLPPAELPSLVKGAIQGRDVYGHFEIPRGAILESFVVFDEPHILAESGLRIAEVFVAITYFLARMGVPTIYMSATLPHELIRCLNRCAIHTRREFRVLTYGRNEFRDKGFENEQLSKKITTRVVPVEELGKCLSENVSSWDRVLVVVNTVERAIELWKALREYGPMLLHGRLTVEDRNTVLNYLMKRYRWIVVATQVVEAGVNLSAQCLVTDIAPPTSLIQRAGRVARFPQDSEGKVLIVERDPVVYPEKLCSRTLDIIKKVTKKAEQVYWRIPYLKVGLGYQELLDRVGGSQLPGHNARLRDLLSPASTPHMSIRELASKGLPREHVILPVIVADELPTSRDEYEALARKYGLGVSISTVRRLVNRGDDVLLLRELEGGGLKVLDDKKLLKSIISTGAAAPLLMMVKRICCLIINRKTYRWLAYGEDTS